MKTFLKSLILFLGIGSLASCSGDTPTYPQKAISKQFQPNDVWTYKTRPGEEDSRVIIGKIEEIENSTIVIHLKIIGLEILNPQNPDKLMTHLSHSPILAEVLKESVIEKVGSNGNLDGFEEGYLSWLSSYQNESAGVFSISVAEIVSTIEEAIKRSSGKQEPFK